ncbi:hypothetical protein DNAM5_53 [Haloarcula californiae tailed virus 1]|uniref:Uncharacterized protein n=1 Tax=Haloarcula californiae tailed virus 1 TaxID=1273746 RepID=R4THY6_9CAUD|nr:hypothetical protein M202_gp053 [Haloarcula californiae tailed virus 1]AGM11916.1 hypothetical protein DNAM5_53 [Haloarcula californiae tailed virus 1]UBF23040.1 hypothetical protein HCTV-16_gp57 [Haloarcula virus HCTV-16]
MFGQEGKEKYEVEVKVPPSNYLSLPKHLIERHLTEDCYRMAYQAQSAGTHFQALLTSANDNILLRIPFSQWRTGRMYERKLNDWSLYLERWADDFESQDTIMENGTEKRVIEMTVKVIEDDFIPEDND